MKKISYIILLLFLLFITSCNIEHIEDTNGKDDYSLCYLTDEDIIKSTSTLIQGSIHSTNGKRYKETVKKFSGVHNIINVKENNDTTFYIEFTVKSGNGLVAIISDKNIVKKIYANTNDTYILNSKTKYSIRVVGESCNYELVYVIK